jgi:flagellar basal-body rod modification protein FlgD
LYSEELTDISGLQTFTWDGKNNSGVQQDAGAYTLVVKPLAANGETFTDEDGDPASVAIGIIGSVDSVDIDDDDIYLRIGDVSVPFSTLTNVKLGASGTEDTADSGNNNGSDVQDEAA